MASVESLLSLIKPYMDMLILASGHQSSGLEASWTPDSIKSALHWGNFFENVLKELRESDESVCELDSAIADLSSNPLFPKGLGNFSSETLSNARNLMLQRFVQSQPLMSTNLSALFTAVIEMEMEYISKLDEFNKRNYVDKLQIQMEALNSMINEKNVKSFCLEDCTVFKAEKDIVGPLFFLIEEILKRKGSVLYISSAEKIIHFIQNSFLNEKFCFEGQQFHPRVSEKSKELIAWKEWKSKSLEYILSVKTIKVLSGANLIFSASKDQWIRVLQNLMDSSEQNFTEVMEICLLGLIANWWNHLVEGLISQECDFVHISTQFSKLQNLMQNNSHENNLDTTIEINSKDKDILEFVVKSLTSQPHQIWLIPSILFTAAIPPWTILFKIYMAEVAKHFDETAPNEKCDLVERIRALYTFHVKGDFTHSM